jgi:hypothetical protein
MLEWMHRLWRARIHNGRYRRLHLARLLGFKNRALGANQDD